MSRACSVLLVEDEEMDLKIAARALRKNLGVGQVELRQAATMEEAADTLKVASIDAIVLDLGLPGTQGLDTVAAMRDLADGIPIVVMTGQDDDVLGGRCLDLGADDYVPKHRVADELRRTLDYCLRRRAVAERHVGRYLRALTGTETRLSVDARAVVRETVASLDVAQRSPSLSQDLPRLTLAAAHRLAEENICPADVFEAVGGFAARGGQATLLLCGLLAQLGRVYAQRATERITLDEQQAGEVGRG